MEGWHQVCLLSPARDEGFKVAASRPTGQAIMFLITPIPNIGRCSLAVSVPLPNRLATWIGMASDGRDT